jgi:iron complex outermembrane recepter protein
MRRNWCALLFLPLFCTQALCATDTQSVTQDDLESMSIEQLMELEVTTVSKRAEQFSTTAASLTVITSEDIRRSGINNLPDLLRLASGIHVAKSSGRTWAISSRGFNASTANKLLVLIDGRSVYTPLFSGTFWDVQDTLVEDIERIEIIRGPGGTLWGANAVNGVINVITRRAKDTQGALVTASVGNEEIGVGAFRYGSKIGDSTFYRAYGKYRYNDPLAFTNGQSARDPLRMGRGGFRIDTARKARDNYTLQGEFYRGLVGESIRPDSELSGGHLLGRWERKVSDENILSLQLYYDNSHRLIPGQFEERRGTYDVEFQHQFRAGRKQRIVWGGGYRATSDHIYNSSTIAFIPDKRTSHLGHYFLEDQISLLNEKLKLSFGTKIEHSDFTNFEYQPTARFSWVPQKHHNIWGSVSRAVRMPTRLDDDIRFLAGPVVTLRGDREFKSETVRAYEAGYRVLLSEQLSFDTALFYNQYDDLRSLEPTTPGTFPFVIRNLLEGDTYGGEAQVNYQVASYWQIRSGYSYLVKKMRLKEESRDPTLGRGEGNDPRHIVKIRSYLDLPHRTELDLRFRYVSQLPDPFVPSYSEVDLRLGWRARENLELSLIGENLLDAQHAEFGPLLTREEVERSIKAKLVWRF